MLALNGDAVPNEITEKWIFCKENAHPKAIELLQEDFYWDAVDDFAPFGSDNGHDMLYMYRNWRIEHPDGSIDDFILRYEQLWGFPFKHLFELDVNKIDSFQDGSYYFISIDKGLIALCFAGLVLDGKIDADTRKLALHAYQRQLSDEVKVLYDSEERTRKFEMGYELVKGYH
ncbi:MAG: hypothetical protein AAGJ93_17770 [Bacteroidota bacterium]